MTNGALCSSICFSSTRTTAWTHRCKHSLCQGVVDGRKDCQRLLRVVEGAVYSLGLQPACMLPLSSQILMLHVLLLGLQPKNSHSLCSI